MRKFYKAFPLAVVCLFLSFSVSAQKKLSESKHGPAISSYLKTSAKTGKLSFMDIENIYIEASMPSEKSGLFNVYLNQYYQGIKISNVTASVAIKNNEVFYFGGAFEANVAKRVNATKPIISPHEAIVAVANYYGLGEVKGLSVLSSDANKKLFSKGSVSKENIPIELVYFKNKTGDLKLAWDLSIYKLDGKHWWSVRIDALNGSILDSNDWVVECQFENSRNHNHIDNGENRAQKNISLFKSNSSILVDGSRYNVYALPTESPNHGDRAILTEPADLTASRFGWHDDNGSVGAEYTTTQGNNVIVYFDENGNNSMLNYKADGGTNLNFDFPIDFEAQPSVSKDASLTNLFYLNNVIHDITFHYGFNEFTGNFQKYHYSRFNKTGENDPVIADGLDGSGIDNANFATPPDGTSPRMQMYLWNSLEGNALTINNGSLQGGYVGVPAGFGPELPATTPITADLALALDDNSSASTDPYDACDPLTNSGNLTGKIAIINRGTCEFGFKLKAVQEAGAIAAIVITDDRPIGVMGGGEFGDQVTIPGIMISRTDGDAIIAALEGSQTVSGSLIQPPFIDGNYDNGVVIHEYGHGISTRLTGGASQVNCLQTCTERDSDGQCVEGTYTEQMGEGWSDWLALILTMKSTDDGATGRGIGTYDVEQSPDGPGIRPYRYSTDMSINPMTYDFTNRTTSISAPHGVGTVWCAMLWDLTWKYIEKYGFDADWYNGNGGNNKVLQIVLDAMKLQPCNPGFVDGRDAILAADLALTGGQDQCMIWEVFARRGLGVNADQQDSLLRNDQIENFDMPDTSDPSLANCTTLSSEEFGTSDYKIYPNPAKSLLNIKPKMALGDVTMTLVDINGRTVLQNKANFNDTVTLDISGLQTGLYILNINGDFINTNEKILIE